ncbi:hypothetical protein [Allocoleopsis franciscana]|uniref:hypothetical protein n=1 Tax=Allocoleopsis franciscana TaxID=2886352 RepID=UPI0012DD9E86|nr:hypothetical protein [Allocoleopsis franciscana]
MALRIHRTIPVRRATVSIIQYQRVSEPFFDTISKSALQNCSSVLSVEPSATQPLSDDWVAVESK